VNLRLFHLDDRAPGIRKIMEFFVEGITERHAAERQILVVVILNRKATNSGVTVPNFTGFVVIRCAAFQSSVYCSSPRPIGPMIFGITCASR
jgi:hypothetical protein